MTFLADFGILFPYWASAIISGLAALVLLREHQEVPGRGFLGLMMASVSLLSLTTFFEDASFDLLFKLSMANLEYLFIGAIPVLFLLFSLRFTFSHQAAWYTSKTVTILLFALPGLIAALVWLDPFTGWVRHDFRLVLLKEFSMIGNRVTPLYWSFLVYCYVLSVLALGVWARGLLTRPQRRTLWPALAFIAICLPLLANILVVAGINPWPGHDPTAVSFSVVGLILMFSLGRVGFLSVLPAARQTVMQAFSLPILIFDRQSRLAYWNTRAEKTWSLAPEFLGSERSDLPSTLRWLPSTAETSEQAMISAVDPGTGVVWEVAERPLRVRTRFRGSLMTFHDVSALESKVNERSSALEEAYFRLSDELQHRRRTEEQLFYYSLHDSLTGLANRSLFLSRLGQAVDRAKRTAEERFGVVLVNFVGFKVINERLGHTVGDEFLVQAALRLGRTIRTVDTAARASADTFLLLLDGISAVEQLWEAVERVRSALESPLNLSAKTQLPSVRMGFLLGGGEEANARSPEELLGDAEIALARGSLDPRSPLVLFQPAWRRAQVDHHELKDDFGKALISGDLHLVYQPIVDLATGETRGYEALTRWTHPQRGLVPPNLFIPLAEKEGTIRPLGLWVLREAARTFVEMGQRNPALQDLYVAVNVSPLQLAEPDFATIVLGVLAREGLNPRRLSLEITETALVENSDALLPVLRSLREQGIGIKLDDFGTGYSSLHALHRLPVDTLKIDRSFVIELPQGRPIIKTIIGLASELGLDVVAEGIEDSAQRTWLQELGCHSGQGYLFSKGWTAEELGSGVEAHRFRTRFADPLPEKL